MSGEPLVPQPGPSAPVRTARPSDKVYMLFCTANIPPLQIERCLEAPSAGRLFYLVKDRNEDITDPVPTPTDMAALESWRTPFLDWISLDIRDWIDFQSPELRETRCNVEAYVVLNAASIEDNAAIFAWMYSPEALALLERTTRNAREVHGAKNGQLVNQDWWEWRVPFEDLDLLAEMLETMTDFYPLLFDRAFIRQYSDRRNVFMLHVALHDYANRQPHVNWRVDHRETGFW